MNPIMTPTAVKSSSEYANQGQFAFDSLLPIIAPILTALRLASLHLSQQPVEADELTLVKRRRAAHTGAYWDGHNEQDDN